MVMDRNRSLERRYSFNASIKNPAAESTKLNLTNGNRSGLGSSFKWGSSPISPKQRSNSSAKLINVDSTIGGNGLESSRCRSIRKIDPRIVADVQSRGLASRIVKYHENGNRLNRSMSAHNLYSKPGQFPVVTLRKTDLPYRATKQNVSMTRIAPPEKSVFYGSTLSSLLRSNSVVGLHKSDEDISRENRPILHPPPTENDMAPTRSVLDVLKEISRKRINSDDPDEMETSKKNRIGNDLVDTGAQTMMTQSFKRQRDLNSPQNGDAITSSKYQDARFSPEQAKKRVCNYNNDITSSLSSSAKRNSNVNKRSSYQLNQTMPPNLESYESQKNKTPKCDERITNTDVRFNNLENTTAKVVNSNVGPSTMSEGTVFAAVPPRSKSEPIPLESGRTTVPNNKPRLTLFNKKYDVNNESCENTEVDDNSQESGECAGIQFVKPKKLSSVGLKNPVIERTQKSKLALMLSGLRGELYQESDNDELDAPQPKQDKKNGNESIAVEDAKKSDGAGGIATTSPAPSTNISTFSSSISPIAVTVASKLPEKADTTSSKTQFTIKNASSNPSPLVGLKLTPPTTKTNVSTAPKTEVSTPTLQGFPSSSAASLALPVPSFNTTATGTLGTTMSLSTMTQSTFASKPLATFQTTHASDLATSMPSTANVANISFGNIPKATTTSTTAAAVPVNTFAFSTANGIMTNKAVITTATAPPLVQPPSVTTSAPSVVVSSSTTASTMFSNNFSFGSKIATTSAPSQVLTLKPVATSASAGPFSFGSPSNLQTNLGTPTVKSSGTFPSATATTAPAANMQFSFGSAMTPNTNTPAAGTALNFGLSNTDKSSMFNVGTPKATPTVISVAEATIPTFGLPAPSTASIFGSASTSTASNMFGSTNAQAQSMFGPTAPKAAFGSEGSNKPSPSVFGGPSTENSVLPAINFGHPSADKPVNKPTAAVGGFSFGSANTGAPGGGSFSFGGTNSSSNANSSNSVQAPTGQSTTFSFGAGANAPEKNNSTNIFGGSASARPSDSSTGGFSFGSAAGAAAVQKPASAFAFGAPSSSSSGGNSSLSSSAGGFSFGAVMQQKANDSPLAKSFSFGSSVPNNNQTLATTSNNPATTNMFAQNMMNKPVSAAFNFGTAGTTTPQATVGPAAANNIFAPSVNMTAAPVSGDRPIRRATRRLQK